MRFFSLCYDITHVLYREVFITLHMSILFSDIVFGPIKSRRFGNSLGINLLPLENKVCNFNCIYCECGWTDLKKVKVNYFDTNIIVTAIEKRFKELQKNKESIDSITFAGNGEPTMHPDFDKIIDAVISLRNSYLPGVKITVLSNSALLGKNKVFNALLKVDKRVLKLDAGNTNMLNLIDMPLAKRDINWYIEKLKLFNGDLNIQTIFLKGTYNEKFIDNTSNEEINTWISALKEIKPKEVMIYTIDRETPASNLEKIKKDKLDEICLTLNREGIIANVYY